MTTSNSALNLLNSDSILPESTQSCQDLFKPTQTYSKFFLNTKHQADIQARGLLNNWARSSSKTVTAEEASFHLGYAAKSGGILFIGHNGQIQFRPDKPWKKDGEKKAAPKYRSPLGEFDAFLPPSPDNPLYWEIENLKRQAFYLNEHPYILITEGIFKAIAGCSNGIPTISLLGVEQGLTGKAGDVEGKRFLVPALRFLAEAGFGFIIAFDADVATNPNVQEAQKKLAKQLAKFKVPVRIITGAWLTASVIEGGEVKSTKGMDDFIQHKGIEEFRAILTKAKLFDENDSEPDGDSKDSDKKRKQLPPPSAIAAELAEIYREKLAWESEYQLWRHYGAKYDGLWGVETEETVKGLIHAHLRSQDLPGFAAGYVSSIATILKSDLEVTGWDEKTGLIPLRDGVLDQLTQELKPHRPGYRFTWQLPFKWADRFVGCEPIEEFLLKITDNQDIANVLLAFLSAIVTRRSDLQRYLELKGGGGTGKSTFMALARDLIGAENTVSSQLKHLENNQFETARLYGKSLVVFPDSERWQGEVSVFKKLTGQDPIRYERKNVQQCDDFIFKGMVMLSANEAPETRDLTSGPERRKLTIELDIRVPEYADRELAKEFKPFLPGLLKRVLDISPKEVTRLIKYTDREVPALAATKWKQLCETNPIAGWLDEKVIIKPDAKGYIGLGDVEDAGRRMFASFCKWQLDNGHRNTGTVKWFSKNLRDLLKHQIKVDITEGRDRDGTYIGGIGLRCLLDPGNTYPRSVTKLPFCEGLMQDDVGCVKAETLADAKNAGYAGFSSTSDDTENFQLEIPLDAQKNPSCRVEGGKNPTNPTHPTPASVPAYTEPSQSGKNPTHQQKTFNLGDRVKVDVNGKYQGACGQIVDIFSFSLTCMVQFDAPVQGAAQEQFKNSDLTKTWSLPAASKFKVGDRVQMRADYITPELRGQRAVVVKDFGDDRYQIDFGCKIKTPFVEPKRFFWMDKKYFHHVTDGEQLEMPF
jgi:putative DNA primase/helicase